MVYRVSALGWRPALASAAIYAPFASTTSSCPGRDVDALCPCDSLWVQITQTDRSNKYSETEIRVCGKWMMTNRNMPLRLITDAPMSASTAAVETQTDIEPLHIRRDHTVQKFWQRNWRSYSKVAIQLRINRTYSQLNKSHVHQLNKSHVQSIKYLVNKYLICTHHPIFCEW